MWEPMVYDPSFLINPVSLHELERVSRDKIYELSVYSEAQKSLLEFSKEPDFLLGYITLYYRLRERLGVRITIYGWNYVETALLYISESFNQSQRDGLEFASQTLVSMSRELRQRGVNDNFIYYICVNDTLIATLQKYFD